MPVKSTAELVLKVNLNKVIQVGKEDKDSASPFTTQTLQALARTRLVVRAALEEKGILDLPSIREQLEPVEWLRRGLQVGYLSPELLSISLTGTNPLELEILVD